MRSKPVVLKTFPLLEITGLTSWCTRSSHYNAQSSADIQDVLATPGPGKLEGLTYLANNAFVFLIKEKIKTSEISSLVFSLSGILKLKPC